MDRDEKKQVRIFGIGVGVIFGLISFLLWRKGFRIPVWILGPIASVSFLTGAFAPGILAPVFRRWLPVAKAIGRFQTRVILTVIFFLTVVPTGIILRLVGKDLLDMKPPGGPGGPGGNETLWKNRKADREPDLDRQF